VGIIWIDLQAVSNLPKLTNFVASGLPGWC